MVDTFIYTATFFFFFFFFFEPTLRTKKTNAMHPSSSSSSWTISSTSSSVAMMERKRRTKTTRRQKSVGRISRAAAEKEEEEESKHMHLLEEKLSKFGAPLQVYYCDEEYEIPSFRDTTILIRSTTPDAVLSEMRGKMSDGIEISATTPVYDKENATISSKSKTPQVMITGGVFDLFASAVALVLEDENTNSNTNINNKKEQEERTTNVAILGLGAGTCARLIDDLYPSNKRVKMYGYELDDVIVDLGMRHFGMNELKEKGSLVDVWVGDALENINIESEDDDIKFDLIIVDLFDDQSRVIPQLLEVECWKRIAKRLKNHPSSSSSSSSSNVSRVICNLSTGRGRGANINNAVHVAELIAETCGNGDISIWPSSKMNVWNECCISGPKPSFRIETTPKVLATYCPHWISTNKYAKKKSSNHDDDDDDGDDEDEDIPMNGWLLDRLQGR